MQCFFASVQTGLLFAPCPGLYDASTFLGRSALGDFVSVSLRQHRIIRQGSSARDLVPVQSSENAGILYVFPVFGATELVQKIRGDPQTQLCGAALKFSIEYQYQLPQISTHIWTTVRSCLLHKL